MGREIRMSSQEVERGNRRKLMLEISLELTQGFFKNSLYFMYNNYITELQSSFESFF